MAETGTTGSIRRAKEVLDVMAQKPLGASLSQIIAGTEFNKTTAHRTLQSLQAINYVYQEPDTRRYFLGSALAGLARRANQSDVAALCGRAMRRLADESEDTIFLSVPEGAVSVCARVELGAFPIRTLTLEPGDRVPLGVGATGQALYAATPKKRRLAAAKANSDWMQEFNFTPELAEERTADFETRGYALNPGIVISGMSAIGLPIVSRNGRLVAALGIGAINERMTFDRIRTVLLPMLQRETKALRSKFSILEKEGLL